MSWSGFWIALLVTFVVQTAVVWTLDWRAFDAFLILTLLVGTFAPTHDARLAAWTAGLLQDLGSADVLGVHAFTLGLTALLLTLLREFVNLNLWWARLIAAFVAAWPGQVAYLTYLDYWSTSPTYTLGYVLRESAWTACVAAVVVAGLSALPWFVTRRRRGWSTRAARSVVR